MTTRQVYMAGERRYMAKSMIKREWNDETRTITASFPDNVQVSYSLADLNAAIIQDCALHGLEQKLFDSIAGEAQKGVTYAEIRERVGKVWTNLVAGEWKGKRGSSEGPSLLLVIEAVARLLAGGDKEIAKKHVESLSAEERANLGQSTEIQVEINKIKNERLLANRKDTISALDMLKAKFAESTVPPTA